MGRYNLLETTSPHSSDDTAKSVSMRCLEIVGLEDGPKRVSGFAVETSDCGSGGTRVSLRSVPLVDVVGEG